MTSASNDTEFGEVVTRLFETILSRKGKDPTSSYTASLLAQGSSGIARKVGEEALEVVIAALSGDDGEIVSESADLLYHLAVLWAANGLCPDDIAAELSRREGVSGHAEKASR